MKIKQITIPEGHNARIEGDKIIIESRDSTDEKIRKWLIDLVKKLKRANPYGSYDGLSASQILDWIKRQKEQIVIKQNIIDSIRANTQPDWDFSTIPNLHKEINRFFGEKFILPHTEDTIITISDVIRCAYHFYKFGQQEQKPAECSEREERLMKALQITNARIAKLEDENYSLKKSKQEWSVEDECKLHGILADYKSMNATYKRWLKSLPERFNLPPKQEWSVEDEDYFQNLIIAVDSTFGEGNTKNWLQNRFKSLSERSK